MAIFFEVFPDSDLPALTPLNSVRSGEGALLTREDALYMPDALGSEVYYKFPLHYTGTHYVLPFDRVPKEDSIDIILNEANIWERRAAHHMHNNKKQNKQVKFLD